MVRRSKLRSSHVTGMEMDQQSWAHHPPPEPGVLFGSMPMFPQPSTHTLQPVPGNSSSAIFHGMTGYNGVPHHHHATTLEFGVAGAPNYCYPNMPLSGSRGFPATLDQGMTIVSMNSFGVNNHFSDGSGSSSKIKNFDYPSSFAFVGYRGNATLPIMEVGSDRSVRNRSHAVGVHTPDIAIQENYVGQPFQAAGIPWLGQLGTLDWNQACALPYGHGVERPHYHPSIHQVQHSLHNVLPPMQGLREQSINAHPQVAGSSHIGMDPFRDSVEIGPRYAGPVPPTGIMIHRPQRRGVMLEATPRHQNLPQLRVLPADEVAILDFPSYYEVGNSNDRHRDMRLDIDHMSYEELLALGERIGDAGTGIKEETIVAHLKTRTYLSSKPCTSLQEALDMDHETDFCVICQIDYKDQENIGTLNCGHEYHFDCIKKWLHMKDACPICKSSAVTTETKDL